MDIGSRKASNEEDHKSRSRSFSSQHPGPSGLVIGSPTGVCRSPDTCVTGNNPPATFTRASSFDNSKFIRVSCFFCVCGRAEHEHVHEQQHSRNSEQSSSSSSE